jgi:hypothetical protein
MHWEYVSKLQLLYPLDEHQGYCPNRWAAAGGASLIATNTTAEINRKCFIRSHDHLEPSSATVRLLRGSGRHGDSWAERMLIGLLAK